SHLQERLPAYMVPAIFVPLAALPQLPNGKLNRKALPAPDTSTQPDATETESDNAAVTPTETQLVKIWQQLLPVAQVDVQDNFFELGGDSILAIQAIARAQQQGLYFKPRDLFRHQTIAALAKVVSYQSPIQADQGPVTGVVPLTPMQTWFFSQELEVPQHWNQSLLLGIRQSLDPNVLDQALQELQQHHDALRAQFQTTTTGWQQIYPEPTASASSLVVVRGTDSDSEADLAETIASTASELQTCFDLTAGSLIRVAYFDFGNRQRLLIVLHHLIVDGLSWRILLEDLQILYHQILQQQAPQLPPKTTAVRQWVNQLQNYANSETLSTELAYWQAIASAPIAPLPRDYPNGENRMANAHTVTVALSESDTQKLLQAVPAVYQTQVNDLLLTAIALAFNNWTGQDRLCLELEGHGREDLFEGFDLSRTVGWFTSLFPVVLELNADRRAFGDVIKQVKETLRTIPNRGVGYGILRYLKADLTAEQARSLVSLAEVRFNYLGQTDELFADSEETPTSWFFPAPESSGNARSPSDRRTTLIEIDGLVSRGQLRLNWSYSTAIHKTETITSLADEVIAALCELIDYGLSAKADQGYTPSDFPQMQLSQGDLDDLLASL
ncbi:MAG: condensation domain-containing protein, partial [Cyanobacteria bacterium P01_H01_bin.121]